MPQFWDIYEKGWEQHSTDLLDAVVRPGSVFVDVGAWVGPLALYAAALGARVIAVEPDPVAAAALLRNVQANREMFENVVSVWQGAIAANGDDLIGIEPLATGMLGDSMTKTVIGGGQLVESWTLPRILEEEQVAPAEIALVKIDVEGYEMILMPILGPWLGERGIPVYVSFHGRRLPHDWFAAYARVNEQVEYVSPRNAAPWGDLIAFPHDHPALLDLNQRRVSL